MDIVKELTARIEGQHRTIQGMSDWFQKQCDKLRAAPIDCTRPETVTAAAARGYLLLAAMQELQRLLLEHTPAPRRG